MAPVPLAGTAGRVLWFRQPTDYLEGAPAMARILLLADEALGWQDLARQLRTCPGVTAVQLTHDRATALALLAHFQPDLLVLGSDHLAEPPDPALLALLAQQPSLLLARTLQAHLLHRLLSAGLPLRGLLPWADLDRAAVPALLTVLVHSPLLVAGPAAAAELAALWREQVGRPRLSPVEQQLLPLLADWQLTYGAIGARLGIAPATVKGRVRRLAAKLGVTGGRLAVVEAARRQGLLPR